MWVRAKEIQVHVFSSSMGHLTAFFQYRNYTASVHDNGILKFLVENHFEIGRGIV
jgi:hypothetical protein